jgi:hypothetical protein
MTRIVFVYDEAESRKQGKLVRRTYQRPAEGAPGVVFDDIAPTICHQDGKVYTSKRALEAAYGSYVKPEKVSDEARQAELRDALDRTYYGLRDGRIPKAEMPRETYDMWKKIERGEL